ncbi:MAG: hypothetical protein L3J80_01575 [Thermoplasmata archaeon]|nr:hypothetical protein [Thermoplasmata archaeon]
MPSLKARPFPPRPARPDGGVALSAESRQVGFRRGWSRATSFDAPALSVWETPRATRLAYWLGALGISLGAAIALVVAFRTASVPPGGDPGNWLATALAYVGRPFPSQVVPLGYPPVTFPLLGAAVLVAGPLGGVDLYAGSLMLALGLSLAALAATVLKSRVVALAVVAFVLVNPSVLAMFFWGAYPNLLGFVFLNLALVGYLRAAQGHPSSGAAQFWGFATLTVLTHSLAGAVLLGTVAVALALGRFLPLPPWGSLARQARDGTLEAPALAARALFRSRGGRAGIVVFAGLVGGYYLTTYLAGIPHPGYFASNAEGFSLDTLTGTLTPVLPGVILPVPVVLALLVLAVLLAALGFAAVRDRRPGWLTAPAVVLFAWPVAITLLILVGAAAKVVTDYRRLGYCYLLPEGLLAGYVVDRLWVARPEPGSEAPDDAGRTVDGPIPGWSRIPPAHRRPAACALVAAVVLVVVLATVTAPAVGREEVTFTRIAHDPAFLDAVGAIANSGTAGATLTIPGADKWVGGLTGENAFAPYPSTALLFYPAQQLDSQLAYFALTSHYAVTNGEVAASVHGTSPAQDTGVPGYAADLGGLSRPILRIPPSEVGVRLHNSATGATFRANLTGPPSVTLPATATGAMKVSFVEPGFWFNVTVSVSANRPEVTTGFSASALPPLSVAEFDVVVSPAVGTSAFCWANPAAGSFLWTPSGGNAPLVTYGNVTPSGALREATSFDPSTDGPAARLSFFAADSNGTPTVGGSLALTTPSTAQGAGGLPGVYAAPAIWQTLGVRFVLWWNATAPGAGGLLPSTEVNDLAAEYGLSPIFENAAWVVLAIPPPAPATTATAGMAPGPGAGP